MIVRRKNKSGKCVSGRRGFLSNRHISQSVSQGQWVHWGGGAGTADVERRSIRSASPCSGLSDRRGRCVCVCACEVCVCVCLRGSSDLGGQRRRARGGPMPSRRESSKWVIFISTLDEMVAAAALLLSAGREISPLSPPPAPWRATRDDG